MPICQGPVVPGGALKSSPSMSVPSQSPDARTGTPIPASRRSDVLLATEILCDAMRWNFSQ